MSGTTPPQGPTEVINARRTESLDAPNILKLVDPNTVSLFGRVNIVNIIEKAVLAVTLSNERDEVLGHAAFFDYPNIPEVDQAEWEVWLKKHYDAEHCTSLNTLFLHYFVAKPEYSHGCAHEIIRTMFNAVPELHVCLLAVPIGVSPGDSLFNVFKPMPKKPGDKRPKNCRILVCNRFEHVPKLNVRNARVEDHDDLVPIFNRQSDILTKIYGEFFLTDLIEAQTDDMQCIVAEVEGTAVGFMSLSTDVNVDLLNECFELGPFHGLHRPDPQDELATPKSPFIVHAVDSSEEQAVHRPSSVQSEILAATKSGSNLPVGSKEGDLNTSSRGLSVKESKENSRAESISLEEVKSKSMLSETKLGDSRTSLLNDKEDMESIMSVVSEHAVSVITETVEEAPLCLRARKEERFIPSYSGPSSVFCIQLFCIDERYEMRSMDFLPQAFQLFQNYDYCIITVPHLVPEFPLLQGFVRPMRKELFPRKGKPNNLQKSIHLNSDRVTPRSPSTLSQELYLFSKPGLLRDFKVRKACSSDSAEVEKLVNALDLNENLLADFQQYNKARRDDDGTPIQAFVAETLNQVVGVAVIRAEENIEYIRAHYNIEDFIYYNHHKRTEHGHLHHYALNPIFKHYSKQFLKDVLRLSYKTCLYYPLYPGHVSKETVAQHTLVTGLSEMVPVRARRQIAYPTETLFENSPSDRVLIDQPLYALNHINRKLTLEPKVTINSRVLVVGASDVGIAFLESFAFCPHLRFNNLTLISPHGLPGELPVDKAREEMLPSSHCYDQQDYDQMALRAWVNVVYGKMTAIDRKKKNVVVNCGALVPYDHLILTTGVQYSTPAPTEADISKLPTSNEVPNSPKRCFRGHVPKNCFVLNDSYDAAVALFWVKQNVLSAAEPVVVYGNNLDVVICIQSLLNLGVSPKRIILVEPPLKYQVNYFSNLDVEKVVQKYLDDSGVTVHSGYLLAQWNDGNDCQIISSVSFTSNTKPIKLECIAFFGYYKKMVDFDVFKAVNDACLVYDGRLVIDANFHTNDLSIRAAGPLTKYQRSYHSDQWTHANFNSKEIGIQLATTMLFLFDPTLEPEPEPPQDLLKLIPMYRSPKIQGGRILGNFYYLHVSKPELHQLPETMLAQGEHGKSITTGTPGGDPEYFRLHINQYNAVETITCLSTKPFMVTNIICLYGVHERFLNNLLSRHKEGLITDLYSFFSETWCLAIFHDRFPDFRDEVRELLITRPSPDVLALEERVRQMIDEDIALSKDQRKILSDDFQDSGAKRAVETRLLSFLSYNYYHLPMYAKPGMV